MTSNFSEGKISLTTKAYRIPLMSILVQIRVRSLKTKLHDLPDLREVACSATSDIFAS